MKRIHFEGNAFKSEQDLINGCASHFYDEAWIPERYVDDFLASQGLARVNPIDLTIPNQDFSNVCLSLF